MVNAGTLVLGMNAAFGLLEAGCVRNRNVLNIMMKNISDMTLGGVVWWICGYTIAFQTGAPWSDDAEEKWPVQVYDESFWFFQWTFAATAATIDSGAIAERVNYLSYVVMSCLTTGMVYPVAVAWVWTSEGYLASLGFLDFAGGAVVHMLGACSALCCCLVVGPRIGRFPDYIPSCQWLVKNVCVRPCDADYYVMPAGQKQIIAVTDAVSLVKRKIYTPPSVRGLRQLNVNGVYVSTTPADAAALSPERAPEDCSCPTCLFAPPEQGKESPRTSGPPDASVPSNGHFFTSGPYSYEQIAASNEEVELVCNVGPTMDDSLKATQGYEPAEHFRCTIASMDGPYSATAEYFGVWDISPDACAEKPCLTYPSNLGPPLPAAYSSTDCHTYEVGGNFSLASGMNCTVMCAAGYKPTGGGGDEARLFVCDRGIYEFEVTCEPRTCTSDAATTGVKSTFAGSTVAFGETLSVECEPGYEPAVASAECVAETTKPESGVKLDGDALSCKAMTCQTPTITGGTADCAGKTFMETCDVTCDTGMMPSTGSPTITCDVPGAGQPGWSELSCIPVTCDPATDTPWASVSGSAGTAGTCVGPLDLGATCTIPCAEGKGGDVDGTSVLVECKAGTNKGVLEASGTSCTDIVCSDSKVAACATDADGCGPREGRTRTLAGPGTSLLEPRVRRRRWIARTAVLSRWRSTPEGTRTSPVSRQARQRQP